MDPSSIGASLSSIRTHFELFVFLLFALPALTFLAMKFWIVGRSAKAQRTTDWFVPTDLDSESARLHYSMLHQSVAFAHRLHPKTRHPIAVKNPSSRRSA